MTIRNLVATAVAAAFAGSLAIGCSDNPSMGDKVEEMGEKVGDAMEEAAEGVEETAAKAGEAYEEARQEGEGVVESGNEMYDAAREADK